MVRLVESVTNHQLTIENHKSKNLRYVFLIHSLASTLKVVPKFLALNKTMDFVATLLWSRIVSTLFAYIVW